MKTLKLLEFENSYEIFPAMYDKRGCKTGGKQFTQSDFDELLTIIFKNCGATAYVTHGKEELLTYAKTRISNGSGKKVFPQIELDFEKQGRGTRAYVSVFEGEKTSVKKLEFCFINKHCKTINDCNI